MANQKVTALTEETAPTSTDIMYLVDDPGGTPTSKKVQVTNLYKGLPTTGSDTTLVSGTAGTNGNFASWNGDGDAVDSGVAVSGVLTSQDVGFVVYADGASVGTGDGTSGVVVTSGLAGDLTDACAAVATKGVTGSTNVQVRRVRVTSAIGASDSQFDITNTAGDTYRYTYDGTGTDPGIADSDASLRAGDYVDITGTNFNAANNGHFLIDAVGANYFEVTNASGAAENDVTIGSGSIIPIKHRNMLSTAVTIGDEYFASDGVINTDYDDLIEGDKVYIDIDAVHSGTAPKGLSATLTIG